MAIKASVHKNLVFEPDFTSLFKGDESAERQARCPNARTSPAALRSDLPFRYDDRSARRGLFELAQPLAGTGANEPVRCSSTLFPTGETAP